MLETNNNRLMLTKKTYDVAKKFAQVYIPAVSALYFGLSAIWGLPSTEQIVGTLAVLDTFLGVCLNLSSNQYGASEVGYDGKMIVETSPTGKVFNLQLNGDPLALEHKESVSFKVVPAAIPK